MFVFNSKFFFLIITYNQDFLKLFFNMSVNPVSLRNLTNSGSTQRYPEPKERRQLSVTKTGWNSAKAIAKKELKLSVSEMIEKIGRGELIVIRNEEEE